jgi:NAD(P)-dependent dehydrogenase (short-subunit alcohol dehydrogenase family)
MSTLEGKVALVTGAARGIGAETARRLAARGARVALMGLEPEELARVAAGCGAEAAWYEADVTDRAAVESAVAGAAERFGGIDVLVANAGSAAFGTVRSIDPDAFERTIDINLLGTWRTVRAALPHLIERRGYALMNASVTAASHSPGLAAYSASKAGVEAFADALRIEVAEHGVGVGVAYFSWIATDLVAAGDGHPAFAFMRSKLRGPFGRTHPLADAVDALVTGVERRSRRIVTPSWVRGVLLVRDLLPRLLERETRDWVPEMNRIAEAEVARRGPEGSLPEDGYIREIYGLEQGPTGARSRSGTSGTAA